MNFPNIFTTLKLNNHSQIIHVKINNELSFFKLNCEKILHEFVYYQYEFNNIF